MPGLKSSLNEVHLKIHHALKETSYLTDEGSITGSGGIATTIGNYLSNPILAWPDGFASFSSCILPAFPGGRDAGATRMHPARQIGDFAGPQGATSKPHGDLAGLIES
jgi:hypothetical protein